MEIFKDINSLKEWRKLQSKKIGLIPTMGALHKGHLSLIRKSKQLCNQTIVSIFVNPIQFNKKKDFNSYPKSIENDINTLISEKVDALFLPTHNSMYPSKYSTFVKEEKVSLGLEGESRPGHFKGVTTIVTKLFNIINPTDAFFGEKDAQQLRVIQRMVIDLNFDINIIPCPIIREKSGLAMSSRNRNLNHADFNNASIIYKGLKLAETALNSGEKSVLNLKKFIKAKINTVKNADVIYVSIANSETLVELNKINSNQILISVAVQFGEVRLIDNITYSFS
ncbi:MAG: pantoate--beta-alanine ligase [Candidatus Marinimicrobia bacterium]|nr:pantoate--beta-alanine ligase [Candidatus Neomarinimicrobiota bacterium]